MGGKQYITNALGVATEMRQYYNHDVRNRLLIQIQIYCYPVNENLRIKTQGDPSFTSNNNDKLMPFKHKLHCLKAQKIQYTCILSVGK